MDIGLRVVFDCPFLTSRSLLLPMPKTCTLKGRPSEY